MKKLLTILFLVSFFAGNSFAQLVNESFDGATFPPTGWVKSSTNTLTWAQSTNTVHPAGGGTHSGTGLAFANSWSVSSGTASLITPAVDFTANPAYTVTFWMYRDAGYLTTADKLEVLVNTTASTTGAVSLGIVNRSMNLAPAVAAVGWYKYTYAVPPTFNGATNYVIFSATSVYGNDVHIDDVSVDILTAPGFAGLVSPANGATGQPALVSLNWSAPLTGGLPSGYKMYLGTNPAANNVINGTIVGNVLTYTPAALNLGTNYFWKVVPTNLAGDASGVSTWTFKTVSDTIMGVVTNGITGDPIRGVNITATPGGNSSTTGDAGEYMLMTGANTYTLVFSKVGFQNVTVNNVVVVSGVATVVNAQMYETAIAPAVITAAVNATDTQCDITWTAPYGPYELLYDDGTAENYAAWQLAGNMNAVKFTPAGYPAQVQGGRVFVGDGSFPAGGNFIGQTFKMVVMDDNGAGGMPGTALDSVDVTCNNFGWVEFSGLETTITSGNFYLTMVQGSVSPNCVPVGVDQTQPTSYKSYSRNVVAGGVWTVSPYQDLMIRAYVGGTVVAGDNAIAATTITPAKVRGMISMYKPLAVAGIEGTATVAALPADAGKSATNYKLYRILLTNPAGPIPAPVPADLIASPTTTTYQESGAAWAAVPMGWYAYAVCAVYPNGDVSDLVYSNKVAHKEKASVTVNVSLTTGGSPQGTTIHMEPLDYPNLAFDAIVPASGQVVIPNVWKGNYTLTAHLYGFTNAVIAANIDGDKTYTIVLEEIKLKPTNLFVDDMTLVATWNAPGGTLADENFEGTFPPAGWQATYQSSVGWYATSNGSSSAFTIPAHTKYAVANDDAAGSGDNGCCDMLITPAYDLTAGLGYSLVFQSFYDGTYGEIATVEMSTNGGTTWTVIKTLTPDPSGWAQVDVDLSDYSGPGGLTNVKFAFHANDAGGWASGWAVDDVKLESGVINVQGYGIFLDGTLVYQPIAETTYTFDPTTINYGQCYVAGVAGIYSNGFSELDTYNFCSHFLYPPRNLTATDFESAALLQWEAPQVGGDSPVDASYPTPTTVAAPAETSATVSTFVSSISTTPAQSDAAILYDNGTIVNSPGTGPGGTDESVIPAGGTTYGFGFQQTAGNSVADDFVVPSAWTIQNVTFQGYQTNAPTTSSITGVYFRIYDGDPSAGGTVVWGDLTTNRMTSTEFAGIYRVSAPGEGTARAVMNITCDGLNISLPAGTYWIEWTATGSASFSGPWVPNVVTSGNAIAYQGGAWGALVNGIPSDLPFVLRGVGGGGGGGEPAGLVSYELFRDNVVVATIPKTELQYFDLNLFPNDYCYDIKAVYDLTSYGFPGTFGRSVKEGPACVNINYGYPVPFMEDFTTGSFSTNEWVIGTNWRMAGQMGNPLPAAQFGWDPPQTDYSLGMESAYINSAAMDTSTSAYTIYLDFDLALADRDANSTEKLTVEIWNGTAWSSVGEYLNAGDLAFATQHIDITSKAKNRVFKVRFLANGAATTNIYYWLVDNINVYYEFAPALNLMSVNSGGFDAQTVHLTWEAPAAGGGGGSTGDSLTEDFEGGSLPAGWLAIDNDGDGFNWINTIEQGFGFDAHSGTGAMTSASYDNTAGPLTPDNWLITPPIPISDLSQLIYWHDAQDPAYADEHYFIKVSTTDAALASFTTTIFDGVTPADWTENTIDLSQFAGETIYIAFQHVDVTDMFWMKLDDIKITELGGDKSVVPSRALTGFNVYRKGSVGNYAKIASTVAPLYDDVFATANNNDCYDYYVTAVYFDMNQVFESGPSNIRQECINVDVASVTASKVNMYPNPATSSVTVDLTNDVRNLAVYNYLGSVVFERNINKEKSVLMNTSDYAAGAYTVRFTTTNGETFSKKLVIIK